MVLALLLLSAAACGSDDEGGPAAAGDRVCPESYVCSVGCLAGRADAMDACLQACEQRADAEARPLHAALMTCRLEQCNTPGAPLEPCLMDKCAAQMGACLDDARTVDVTCSGHTPNDQGIGKECTTMEACTGLVADNCPYAMDGFNDDQRASLPQWCNHLCERDDECGADAFCWQRRSVETAPASVLVGSCALNACLTP